MILHDGGTGRRREARVMLLLMFRNMLWAAWWPYSTMLLALDKAAKQRDCTSAPSQPQPGQQKEPPRPESSMANDAFMQPEIPQPLRDLMKMSIEQARRAFEMFAAMSEKPWKSLESSSPMGRAGLFAMNAKIAEIMRANADANFALAMKLAESKDVQQAIELQSQHLKSQMETFAQQLEEMRDLAAKLVQEATPPLPTGVGSTRSAANDGPAYASYAPSSSITPGAGRKS